MSVSLLRFRAPLHPQTGEISDAQIFVAVLGASSYTFAEAALGKNLSRLARFSRPRL
jgi:transposase